MAGLLDYTNPDCPECEGEGIVVYGNISSEPDGAKEMECQVCFPNGYEPDEDRDDDI
jgi:hypothetical protein